MGDLEMRIRFTKAAPKEAKALDAARERHAHAVDWKMSDDEVERRAEEVSRAERALAEAQGEPVEAQSTPSMWALADEWIDTIMAQNIAAGREHTRAWYNSKLISCIELQAAQEEGLMPQGGFSLVRIGEMLNAYNVDIPEEGDDAEDGDPDPTSAPGAA